MEAPGHKPPEAAQDRLGPTAPGVPEANGPGSPLERAVLTHGDTSMAWLALKTNLEVWHDPGLHSGAGAAVAYRDTGRAWVAAGDPLAPAERRAACVGSFFRAAAHSQRRASVFASELSGALPPDLARLQIGRQPLLDPRQWASTVAGSRTLRQQLRRAARKSVRTACLTPAQLREPDGAWPAALRALERRWLANKSLPPLGFVIKLETRRRPTQRCVVVARAGERLVGLCALSPIPASRGYLLEELMRDPSAPNGTAEALVDAALTAAGKRGARSVSLGLAPLSGVEDRGLRMARRLGEGLYRFSGLENFKAKFGPATWQPVYSLRPTSQARYWAVHDCLQAFAEGSFFAYGLRAALRGPPLVLRALGVLLWPWMALLSLAPEPWYPAAEWRWFWLSFDAAVSLGLLAQSHRFRPWLGRALVAVLAFDTLATWLLATLYNARHLQGAIDAVVLGVACAAPCFALLATRNALERHSVCRPNLAPSIPPNAWPLQQRSPAQSVAPPSSATQAR